MIDTNAIRNRLMHLAVSGKLVGQNMEDGSASELVEKLSKEINNSPRREVTTDEIPYEIPGNWSWCRLSDIGTTNIGLTYHPEDVVIDGIPVLRSNNIKNNKMDFDDLIKVNCEIREKQYINENDILICARNGSKALVGKCAIYNGELGMTSFGAFMAVYRTWCFEYVYYYFQTKVFRRYFENENNKQINQVTQAILKDAIIPLPPMNEQKRIVKKIKETFKFLDIIDNLQQQYSSDLEVLKSKIIDAGIRGKLTEQLPEDGTAEELLKQIAEEKKMHVKKGKIKASKSLPEITEDEIPFEIPDNWKWCRLVDLCKEITDGTHKTPTYIETGVPFLSVKNVSSGHFDFEDVKYISESEHRELIKRCNPEKGDILICRIGTLGKAIEIDFNVDFSIFVSLGLIKPLDSYLSKYLVYVLNSGFGEKWIKKNKAGDAMHAAKINLDVLRSFLVPLPPLLEQTRIVDKIDEMLSIVQR